MVHAQNKRARIKQILTQIKICLFVCRSVYISFDRKNNSFCYRKRRKINSYAKEKKTVGNEEKWASKWSQWWMRVIFIEARIFELINGIEKNRKVQNERRNRSEKRRWIDWRDFDWYLIYGPGVLSSTQPMYMQTPYIKKTFLQSRFTVHFGFP